LLDRRDKLLALQSASVASPAAAEPAESASVIVQPLLDQVHSLQARLSEALGELEALRAEKQAVASSALAQAETAAAAARDSISSAVSLSAAALFEAAVQAVSLEPPPPLLSSQRSLAASAASAASTPQLTPAVSGDDPASAEAEEAEAVADAAQIRGALRAAGTEPGEPSGLRMAAQTAAAISDSKPGFDSPAMRRSGSAVALDSPASDVDPTSPPVSPPSPSVAALVAKHTALAAAAEMALARAQLEELRERRKTPVPDGPHLLAQAKVHMLKSALALRTGVDAASVYTKPSALPPLAQSRAAPQKPPMPPPSPPPPPKIEPVAVTPMDPSLRVVSGAGDACVRLTRLATDSGVRDSQVLTGHTQAVRCVCVLPPPSSSAVQRVASGSVDRSVRVWRVADGACELVLHGHTDTVRSLAALSSDSVVSASDDKTLRVWSALGSGAPACQVLEGHAAAVWAVCVLDSRPGGDGSGAIVSGSWDHTLRLWSLSGLCLKTLQGHADAVNVLCALPGGRVASGSADRTVRLWSPLSSATADAVLSGHTGAVYALCALPASRLASGGGDGAVRIWRPAGGACERVAKAHLGTVTSLSGLGDGRVVSSSSDRMLGIINGNGVTERQLGGHRGTVWAVAALL
jgi:hypothetical protein